MAINTLVTLRDEIQRFVDGHGQIKRVIFEADDHRSAYITEGDEFPVMFVAPIDVIEGASMSTHRLRVYVYERINHGREDVWENANDTSLMLRDLRVWFNSYYDGDINIIEDPNAEFLSDRELDKLVGYFSDFQFELPSHGRCDVPVNITPLPPAPICPEATVNITDSDNDLLGSVVVPSGGVGTFVVSELPIKTDFIVAAYNENDLFTTAFVTVTGTVNDVIIEGLTNVTMKRNGTVITNLTNVTAGDVITFEFDSAVSEGVILIEGYYA